MIDLYTFPYGELKAERISDDGLLMHFQYNHEVKFNKSVYMRMLEDWGAALEALHNLGYVKIMSIIPDEDELAMKFQPMMGFTPCATDGNFTIYEWRPLWD